MTQKVAVVAVHGVADQEPASSARAIADLLENEPEFGKFRRTTISVPLSPMPAGDRREAEKDPSIEYMHDQLAGYKSPRGTYETVRLEGTRNGANPATVHVHEVYWADLSRAGKTWYRLLAEFYALILHLPSLGRNGLRAAQKEHNDKPLWTATRWLQEAAVWLLTVPAALLNVAMLSLGVVALSAELPLWLQPVAAVVPAFLVLAAVAVLGFKRFGAPAALWYATPFVLAGAAAGTLWLTRGMKFYPVLATEGALLAAAATGYIAWHYKAMKRSAFVFGCIAAVAASGLAVNLAWSGPPSEAGTYMAAIGAAQRLYWVLIAVWVSIFITATLAAVAGGLATIATRQNRWIAYRATWTARFSLGLPIALFGIFTLSIWFLVLKAITAMAPDDALQLWHPPLIDPSLVVAQPVAIAAAMEILLLKSAENLGVFVVALACFAIAALWAATPSVIAELRHPKPDADSKSLGAWLSRGLKLVAVAGEIMTAPLLVMVLIAFQVIPPLDGEVAAKLLGGAAAVVAALFTGKYFVPFRSAVDVLLDVDNYLRESPSDAAPRARIAERFHSLLHSIARGGYDTVVIVAHSQGTVISADALRYMKTMNVLPADLPPVHFFTMGSPLKQLYARAFPYLYGWVEDPAVAPADREPFIAATARPDPAKLNVRKWANVYCTGDYVGREIWLDERYARLHIRADAPAAQPFFADDNPSAPTRVQFCAGAGAHTHYWNGNCPDVGRYLNQLI